MPALQMLMEEDFPRGRSFGTDDDATDKNRTTVQHPSLKKKRKKIKDLVGNLDSSTAKDDLLVEEQEETEKAGDKDDDDDLLGESDNLFKKSKTKPTKKQRKKIAEEAVSDDDDDEDFIVEPLTYDSIFVGLLSLGQVSEIKDHEVVVSLPGRTVGSVPLTSISKPYSKLLAKIEQSESAEDLKMMKPLSQMFSKGQVIIVKVIDIKELEDGKRRIILSTDPCQINSSYNATLIAGDMVFTTAVQSIEDHGLVTDMGIRGVRSFLPKNRISSHKYKALGIGSLLKCKVVKSEIQRLVCTVTLTANFAETGIDEDSFNSSLLLPGMQVEANIMQTHKTGLKVYFMELMGTVYQDHTSNPWESAATMEKYGSISATILYIHPTTGSLPALTMRKDLIPHKIVKSDFYPKGRSCQVVVQRFEKRGVIVKFQNGQKGIVSLRRCFQKTDPINLSDVTLKFPANSKHLCRVIEYSALDDVYVGSFAMSHAPEHRSIEELEAGTVVSSTILEWKKNGALISFDGLMSFISEIHFDKFSPRVVAKHPERSKIKVKVVKVNVEEGKIFVTARKKLIKSEHPVFSSMSDIKIGMIGSGTIFKAGLKGIHVTVIGGMIGFIPASFLDVPPAYITRRYIIGEIVTVKVVEVEPKRPTLIFTLDLDMEVKPFVNTEVKMDQSVSNSEPNKSAKKDKKLKKKKTNSEIELIEIEIKDEEPCDIEVKLEEGEPQRVVRPLKRKIVTELKPVGTTFWGETEIKIEESDKSSDEDEDGSSEPATHKHKLKKSKTSKDSAALKKEAEIRARETELADPTRHPESVDDYELLVLASPSSSMCWIKYISYHLEAGNIEEARKIGHRGLEVIPFNEEQERFNVWTALLNLENEYGTEESLKKTFENGLRCCDALEIYKTMAQIYVKSKKNTEAENIFKIMTKKFPTVEAIWSMAAVFLYRIKNLEEARALYTRAIGRLDKRCHVELISKFAQLELTFGDFEQGRSLYEKLVTTYPSRCDLWLVYINQLIKQKDFDGVRALFDRVIHTGINPKKIHPVLKRFLEFEREHGTPESLAYVENTCTEYFATRLGVGVSDSV